MSPGRWPPSLVMDVQVLVTHADRVATMEREMGHAPARLAEASMPAVPALKALLTAPTGHGTGVGQPTDVTPLSAWELMAATV